MNGSESGVGFEVVLVSLAATALILVALVILVQCVQNGRYLRAYHRDLVRRFCALRIQKMLETLGVSKRRYMAKALTVEVEKHLLNCQHCSNTEVCDRALEKGDVSGGEEFCPNFKELVRFQHGHRADP